MKSTLTGMKIKDFRDLTISLALCGLCYFLLGCENPESVAYSLDPYVKKIDQFFTYFAVPLVVIEALYSFFKQDGHHNNQDSRSNLIIGVGRGLIEPFVVITLYVAVFLFANKLTGLRVEILSVKNWIIGLLLVDLCYYWDHRLSHKIKFFWANHSIHHSSTHFNFLTSSRGSWIECSYRWIFLMPMALLGFSPLAIVILFKILRAYQLFQHTDRYHGDSVFFRTFMVTPESHRVHHAVEEKFHDMNFGGIFSIWDHMFKTTARRGKDEKITFGVTNSKINNSNPFSVLFAPIINYFR